MGEMNYRPLIEGMTWSYSRIESFESCPYKFFLRYISHCKDVDCFYASYGSFIHHLIEMYYRGKMTKDEMLTEFLTGFSKNVKGEKPKGDIVKKYIQSGAEYLRSFEPFPYKMVDVEKRVDFDLGGNRFVGYIDFLGQDEDGEYIVIDNKSRNLKPRSTRKTPTVKDKELDTMLRQLYIYSAAVKDEYGKFPIKLCFNCFKAGVFIEEPFRQEAYEEAISWALKEIEEIKDTDEFPPNQEYFLCQWLCGVSGDCMYDQMAKEGSKRWKRR